MDNVLYEISYQLDGFIFIPFIMLAVCLLFLYHEIEEVRIEKKMGSRWLSIGMLSFGLLMTLPVCWLVVSSQMDMYENINARYREGQYETVEGYVENFVPMPREGHANESFEIDGVYFEYSDGHITQGYHNAKSHGGVITGDGQHLRIRYIYYEAKDRNIIVYIEEIDP